VQRCGKRIANVFVRGRTGKPWLKRTARQTVATTPSTNHACQRVDPKKREERGWPLRLARTIVAILMVKRAMIDAAPRAASTSTTQFPHDRVAQDWEGVERVEELPVRCHKRQDEDDKRHHDQPVCDANHRPVLKGVVGIVRPAATSTASSTGSSTGHSQPRRLGSP
jgi:hypothetical protein